VVGFEGPGGRPAGDGVQRGPLDLHEPLAAQRIADRLHDPRAAQKTLQHAFGVDQVQVTHALAQLGIDQPLVLEGRGLDRLGQEVELLGEDAQLARLRVPQLAVDTDDVAQVETLGQGPVLGPDLRLADEHLDSAGPVLDVHEDQLAGPALQEDPPGRPHLGAALLGRPADRALSGRRELDLVLPRADVGNGHVAVEAAAPRVDVQLLDLAELVAARRLKHGAAAGNVFAVWIGHRSRYS